MKFFKYFFSHVPPDPPPEVPKDEPPDPNANRSLSDPIRAARRSLMVVCGLCLAWSSAQFTIGSPSINVSGISVDLKAESIPIVLAVLLIYLTVRWGVEFAMMPRLIRRWTLAQFDFRMVLFISRLSLLAVAAGALDRSLWTIVLIVTSLVLLAVASVLFVSILMFVTMPVRMWARARAGRESAASAAFEAVYWAILFSVCITVVGIIGLGIASYRYEPLREAIWRLPPNPVAFSVFVFTLIAVFLSHWLLKPVTRLIFAERPGYYTERDHDGNLRIHFVDTEKEPLM
jgi:hypothetical protein